jgi:molybdopterin synthase sulfur carrier subunit
VKLLYFAWVRERIGLAEEAVTPPADVRDVASLLTWLKARGDNYAAALERPAAIRVAVNQAHARAEDPVGPDDEVALFPPVTGGLA